jgi:uncharacterized membrane protein
MYLKGPRNTVFGILIGIFSLVYQIVILLNNPFAWGDMMPETVRKIGAT